jgi:hypothetical protein
MTMKATVNTGAGRQAARAIGMAAVLGAAAVARGGDAGAGASRAEVYQAPPYLSSDFSLTGAGQPLFGPSWGRWKLAPRAQVLVAYEDNAGLRDQAAAEQGYVTFSPGVMLIYGDRGRNYVYVDYQADFSSLDTLNSDTLAGQSLTGLGHYETPKTQITAWHRYQEVNDVDLAVGAQLDSVANTTYAGVDYRLSARTSVGAGANHELRDFNASKYTDYRQYGADARLYWDMTPRSQVYAQGAHGWLDIQRERDAFGSGQFDELSLGVRGQLRPRLQANGRVGAQRWTYEDDRIGDATVWVAGGRADAQPFELFKVWCGVWNTIRPAVQAQGYSTVTTRVEPGLSRRLFSDRLIGSASAMFGWIDYRGTSDPDPTDAADPRVYDGREDKYWGYTLALDWSPWIYWSFGGGYSYIENDSSFDNSALNNATGDRGSYHAGRWYLRASFNM